MPTSPVINYAGQPWTAGATWQTNNAGNFGTQDCTDFLNGSNGTLWTGDVVKVGTSAAADPTAFNATTTVTAQDTLTVGVVGGITNQPSAGGPVPFQLTAWRYDSVTTAGTATVTDASTLASDLGKEVIGPGIPSGAYIITVTPGTSFVMNVAATASATVQVAIGPREGSVSAGFPGVPPGDVLPVVTYGWAYVNIGTNTVAAGATVSSSATARVAATGTAALGGVLGVALEANTAGIPSGDGTTNKLIRCYITRM
jgi:hypothetical protein